MKKLAFILIIAFGCGDKEEDPKPSTGCLTGKTKTDGVEVLIRCCTREQYLAGNNVNNGGTANWNNYTDHKWALCSDCK